eukprot:s1232_g5.t1
MDGRSGEPSPLAGRMAKHHIFARHLRATGDGEIPIEGESFQWNCSDRMDGIQGIGHAAQTHEDGQIMSHGSPSFLSRRTQNGLKSIGP